MEQNVVTTGNSVSGLKAYDVPKNKVFKINIPKYWLVKNGARKVELCENAITGNLEIRVVKPAKSESNT
jgi:hypothetical protein